MIICYMFPSDDPSFRRMDQMQKSECPSLGDTLLLSVGYFDTLRFEVTKIERRGSSVLINIHPDEFLEDGKLCGWRYDARTGLYVHDSSGEEIGPHLIFNSQNRWTRYTIVSE